MFLSHLYHPAYKQAILKCQMALTGLATPPTEYTFPTIDGNNEQLCLIPPSRDFSRSNRQQTPQIRSLVEVDDMYNSSGHDTKYEEFVFVYSF